MSCDSICEATVEIVEQEMNSNVFDLTTDATVGCYLKKIGGDAMNSINTDLIDSVRLFCFVLFYFDDRFSNMLFVFQYFDVYPDFMHYSHVLADYVQDFKFHTGYIEFQGRNQWSAL